jgi:hypothetical protein
MADRHTLARLGRTATMAERLARGEKLAPPNDPSGVGFETALTFVKLGYRALRTGWNGKGMHIEIVSAWVFEGATTDRKRLPFIAMLTADGSYVPWLASQTDILAHDWIVVQDGIEITEGAGQPVPVGATAIGNQ